MTTDQVHGIGIELRIPAHISADPGQGLARQTALRRPRRTAVEADWHGGSTSHASTSGARVTFSKGGEVTNHVSSP